MKNIHIISQAVKHKIYKTMYCFNAIYGKNIYFNTRFKTNKMPQH